MTPTTISTVEGEHAKLREQILAERPRLGRDDTFRFGCHAGVACFNRCCNDVNIFLSPYDVLRMRERLGMGSTEFLEKHTLLPVQKDMRTPVVVLRMRDEEGHPCPFVGAAGCSIYADRPWPCRMYPLGLATSKDTADGWRGERFYFLLEEEKCLGHRDATEWTVDGWLENQGVEEFDRWGEAYKEMALHDYFEKGGVLSPEKMEMFYTACYDLDKFRTFVFETSLLKKFEVDEDFVDEMRYSDEALLRFGFLWLRFSLFGEATMKMREEAVREAQDRLERRVIQDSRRTRAAQEGVR